MNRRGFIQGLGALMATSAMVRPAAPAIAVDLASGPDQAVMWWINEARMHRIPALPNGDYVSIIHPSMLADLFNGAINESNNLHGKSGLMYVDEMGDIAYRDVPPAKMAIPPVGFGLHCQHDGMPCPYCSIIQTQVQE